MQLRGRSTFRNVSRSKFVSPIGTGVARVRLHERGVGKCLRNPTDCIEIIPCLDGDSFSALVGQNLIPYPPAASLRRPVQQGEVFEWVQV